MDAVRIWRAAVAEPMGKHDATQRCKVLELTKRETASYTARNFVRRREVKTIMLLLVLMAGAAWGQKSEICKSCPSVADMDRQLYPRLPKTHKPERAKEQRPAKHAPRAKNRSDTEKPRPKELIVGENAHSQTQQP
jgi:hypothetical protein